MSEIYSFSKISKFRTCPAQYEAQYITKSIKFVQSAPAKWGSDVHLAAENCINKGEPLSDRYKFLKPYFDILAKVEGKKSAEVEYAITKDLKPCNFWDKGAWLRGKLDVLIMQSERAMIWDWKSGKANPTDFDELRCFSLLTFLNNPDIKKTKNTYIWLKNDSPPTTEILHSCQTNELLEPLVETIEEIEFATKENYFEPKPNFYCKSWCDVVTCPRHGKGKFER